jgi:hypothetical protein
MKSHSRTVLFILFSIFLLTPTLFAASSQPFFLHFDVICAQPIGTGLNGELLLSITNVSDEMLRDIMISLPQNSKFQFGTNSHSQAGNLPAGDNVVVRENLFDPEGISQTGSMTFIMEYTDASGNRQRVEVPAIGNVGGAP